jgi:hypothetical protein
MERDGCNDGREAKIQKELVADPHRIHHNSAHAVEKLLSSSWFTNDDVLGTVSQRLPKVEFAVRLAIANHPSDMSGMSDRSSLEKALSNWTYRKEGKMQIVATAEMRRQHTALLRNNRIPKPDLSPVERRARMELNGNPLAYKPEPKLSNPNDPTPEWQRKANGQLAKDIVGKGELIPVKRYRIRHVVEQHGDKFEMSQRSALERFFQDATYAQRIKIVDLNRSGGPSGGDRLGGLGMAPQHVRDGHARNEWVRAQLAPELLITASALVSREMTKPDGSAFSLEDFGAQMFPSVQDKNRRWGAGAGAIWALASQLVLLYAKCPIRVRRIDESERLLESRA